MNTDDRLMDVLERANPVPPETTRSIGVNATRYLEDIQQRSLTVTSTRPTETATTRRWAMMGAAAAVVALIVGGAFLIRGDDENPVVDTPDSVPATAPVTAPPTLPPAGLEDARAVATSLFDAYNAGRTDELLSLLSDDVELSEDYHGLPPDPDNAEVVPAAEFENLRAWELAQGQEWADPVCDVADEQLESGATLSCRWETKDALMQAVDGAPAATQALIVVSDGEIVELHLVFAPAFDTLSGPFHGWLSLYSPEEYVPEVVDAYCCAAGTRDESELRGRVRAAWASRWATWLETWGCDPGGPCNADVDDWVAEYSRWCGRLKIEWLVEEMTFIPRPIGNPAAARLFDADQSLTDGTHSDEQVAELQQRRLDAMIELGIRESCHPDVGSP